MLGSRALQEPTVTPAARAFERSRLLSLDVFRGVAVAGMILVNHPGNPRHVWPPLAHAHWNGCTLADLLFPAFLFIVGVAIAQSMALRKQDTAARGALLRRILLRTLTLFVLGLFLNAFPFFDLAHLRIPGVLQRIAICYLLASLAFLGLSVTGQAVLTVGLLAAYWALMTWVPVPGVGPGVLQPGSDLGAWLDRLLLRGHLAHGSWDPEGLLSTLPALASTLMGVFAGHWMRGARSATAKSVGLVVAGLGGITLGAWLGHWFPINKNLWTSSFAVFTGGTSALLFGLACWTVDVRKHRRPAVPFVVFGRNPIALYVLATLVAKLLDVVRVTQTNGTTRPLREVLYRYGFASWAGPTAGSLLFALVFVAAWLVPMAALYRRGVFIRV
jgi:predicted acyltransferase